jgi:hypothetical protein
MCSQLLGFFFFLFSFNAQSREALPLKPGAEQEIIQKQLAKLKELRAKSDNKDGPDIRLEVLQIYGVIPLAAFREEARISAEAALKQDNSKTEYGYQYHYASVILGRLALLDGKIPEAEEFLRKAGKTKGDPVLNSFGPNMMLARDLLRKGSKQAVLNYFDDCLKFWKLERVTNHGDRIAAWKSSIAKGKEPDFGVDLFH